MKCLYCPFMDLEEVTLTLNHPFPMLEGFCENCRNTFRYKTETKELVSIYMPFQFRNKMTAAKIFLLEQRAIIWQWEPHKEILTLNFIPNWTPKTIKKKVELYTPFL